MQETILRKRAVLAQIGMGSTWLNEAVNAGEFPSPIKLGKRAVGWKRSDVEAWLTCRSLSETDLSNPKPLHWAFPEYALSDVKMCADPDMEAAAYQMYRALHNAAEFMDRYFLCREADANRSSEGIVNTKAEAAAAYRMARTAIKKAERRSQPQSSSSRPSSTADAS